MKLKDLLKEIKAIPSSSVIVSALIDKLKADDQFDEGSKVVAYRESKFKLKGGELKGLLIESYLIELLIQTKIKSNDGKSEFKIVEYFYYPEFDLFAYHYTYFDFYDPEGEKLQTLIKDRYFTKINPPITEIKAKPALKLPSGFDIEQAFYDFFNLRQVSSPKGKFNKDEQFLGIKYYTFDGEDDLIIFYFQVGGMFNEKFQVAYNLDDPYTPNKNYTKWLGYQEIDQTDLMKEIKAVPARAHPLNIEKMWDFVSQDELKGELGPFDINKNYIGFKIRPFMHYPNKEVHLLGTYFRDNNGNPFSVIYSYNYGRENGYDFFNWRNENEDEIPNDLLREIKTISGRLPFSSEEVEKELYKRNILNTGYEDYLSYIGYTQENIEKNDLIIYALYYKIKESYFPEYLKIKIWYTPSIGTYEYDRSELEGRSLVPFDKLIK